MWHRCRSLWRFRSLCTIRCSRLSSAAGHSSLSHLCNEKLAHQCCCSYCYYYEKLASSVVLIVIIMRNLLISVVVLIGIIMRNLLVVLLLLLLLWETCSSVLLLLLLLWETCSPGRSVLLMYWASRQSVSLLPLLVALQSLLSASPVGRKRQNTICGRATRGSTTEETSVRDGVSAPHVDDPGESLDKLFDTVWPCGWCAAGGNVQQDEKAWIWNTGEHGCWCWWWSVDSVWCMVVFCVHWQISNKWW